MSPLGNLGSKPHITHFRLQRFVGSMKRFTKLLMNSCLPPQRCPPIGTIEVSPQPHVRG